MAYPELPWKLKGEGPLFGSFFLSDIKALNTILPRTLRPISVLPGKTIGSFYYCKFGKGSEVEYHEFVIFPALVKCKGKYGFWGQVMYVDNPVATVGIYERSGIRKELASFSHNKDNRTISIVKDDKPVCTIRYKEGGSVRLKRTAYSLQGFGVYQEKTIHLAGIFKGELGKSSVTIDIRPDSPIEHGYLRRQFLGTSFHNFEAELFTTLGTYY